MADFRPKQEGRRNLLSEISSLNIEVMPLVVPDSARGQLWFHLTDRWTQSSPLSLTSAVPISHLGTPKIVYTLNPFLSLIYQVSFTILTLRRFRGYSSEHEIWTCPVQLTDWGVYLIPHVLYKNWDMKENADAIRWYIRHSRTAFLEEVPF